MNGFLGRLERAGTAVNYATLVGNGAIRSDVLGPYDRPATDEELAAMRAAVRAHMEAGCVGLSSGLEYAPSSFASAGELTELCREVAAFNGVYATHIRDESDGLLDAVNEAVAIGRDSGAGVQISHFKACYKRNWDKLDAACALVDEGNRAAGNVHADRYPYHAYSTGLSMFFPMWAREGRTEDFIGRLKDPALDGRIRAYFNEVEVKLDGMDNVLISSVFTDGNKPCVGKTVLACATEAGKTPYDFSRDLIIGEDNRVSMIGFAMSEDNLERVLAHPLVMVGSDGNALADYGPLSDGNPHPRSYGTFPRVLGRFVREKRIMPLETAVRKMSGMPADSFGLEGRGYLREGYYGDVTVFDPDTVIDTATWAAPHQYPDGIPHVVVNGRVAVREGEHTGELAGMVIRKGRV